VGEETEVGERCREKVCGTVRFHKDELNREKRAAGRKKGSEEG